MGEWFLTKNVYLGGFGHDFSSNTHMIEEALSVVSAGLVRYGVTSYCPTVVTSPTEVYQKVSELINSKL